jgi:hypothetical protein
MTGKRVRVVVPELIGMEIIPAYRMALIAGVALRGRDPGPPLPLRGVITAQQPGAGTLVWSGDSVTISLQPSPTEGAAPSPAARRPGDHRAHRGRESVDDL